MDFPVFENTEDEKFFRKQKILFLFAVKFLVCTPNNVDNLWFPSVTLN